MLACDSVEVGPVHGAARVTSVDGVPVVGPRNGDLLVGLGRGEVGRLLGLCRILHPWHSARSPSNVSPEGVKQLGASVVQQFLLGCGDGLVDIARDGERSLPHCTVLDVKPIVD